MILSDKLSKRILEIYKELDSQGKILTKSQIDRISEAFRNRFSPARLNSIDGETLLETMHYQGNSDSLVYWLEFKNDDELPFGPTFCSNAPTSPDIEILMSVFEVFLHNSTN